MQDRTINPTPKVAKTWREKATAYNVELHYWKRKYKDTDQSCRRYKAQSKQLREELRIAHRQNAELLKERGVKFDPGQAVKSHSYRANEIRLFLHLRELGMCSLRGCARVVMVLSVVIGLEIKTPSASTIRRWENKMGYGQIHRSGPPSGSYALIVDEGANLGGQKVLLLLGVNLEHYRFERPLRIEDVEILSVCVRKSWKAKDIKACIEEVIKRGFVIDYGCSDEGSNIVKALRDSDIDRFSDCTHALGKLLEKCYKTDETFLKFTAETTRIKRQLCMSRHDAYSPPHRRDKARFLNLEALSKWANLMLFKVLTQQGIEQEEIYQKLGWLNEMRDFVEELGRKVELNNRIMKILKHRGMCKKTYRRAVGMVCKSEVEPSYKTAVLEYLTTNYELLGSRRRAICTSDVIESVFGKLKNTTSSNVQVGLSEGVLRVANYGHDYDEQQVKQTMESVHIKDLKEWRENNLVQTAAQRKKQLQSLGKNGARAA